MQEQEENLVDPDLTFDDRMWAALSWLPLTPLWPILAVVALLADTTKDRPFVRHHATLSLVTGVLLIPLSIVTVGCAAILYLVFFYWAYQAYQGRRVEIPVSSDLARKQGWT
jgi:uncharacterized membrane protein